MTNKFFKVAVAMSLLAISVEFTGMAQCSCPRKDSLTVAQCDWGWETVARKGKAVLEVGYAQLGIFGGTQSVSLVRYPSKAFRTSVVESDAEAAAPTSTISKAEGALASINGSYFNMKKFTPTTFVKDEGKVVGQTTGNELYRCNGMLRISGRKGRNLDILEVQPAGYSYATRDWREAIVAGPVILQDGIRGSYDPTDRFNTTRHPRTLMGYTPDGIVYLIVVDGRFPGQADGMSMDELRHLCMWLGLCEAINLDGGGSSTLWTSTRGVVNHPFDNKKFDHEGERRVPNIIAVY